MISSCPYLALTRLAGITFAGVIMCSAISFPVARFILTKNIAGLCPAFNLRAFEGQQLYEIWPYMGSVIICMFVFNPIYCSSDSASSNVHLKVYVRLYGSVRCLSFLMKSVSSSQCLRLVYAAWSWSGDRTISLPFHSRQITTMNVVFGNSGRLLLTFLLTRSLKSVASRLFPPLPFFLASRISHAHFFEIISTHCRRILLASSKLSNGSQLSNVFKKSATSISQCRGPSLSCFNWFCPRMRDRCFFSRNPATHTFFH